VPALTGNEGVSGAAGQTEERIEASHTSTAHTVSGHIQCQMAGITIVQPHSLLS
jgi:hypothetical protein